MAPAGGPGRSAPRSEEGTVQRAHGAINPDKTIADDRVVADSVAAMAIALDKLAGEAKGQAAFRLTFDNPLDPAVWAEAYSPTITYPSNGVSGGKVYSSAAKCDTYMVAAATIPYDSSKLHRLRIRVRRTATADAAQQTVAIGLRCYDKSRTLTGLVTPLSANAALWTLNQWYVFTYWFKGLGAAVPTVNAASPGNLPANSAYYGFEFFLNYNTTNTGNVMEIDEISVDVFDEDGANRIYLAAASTGPVGKGQLYPEGTTLEVKLMLPAELPVIKIAAKVAHSQPVPGTAPEKPAYHTGTYFPLDHRSCIIRYVFGVHQRVTSS